MMEVINDILARYPFFGTTTIKYCWGIDDGIYIDEHIHLDRVLFLIQRKPDVLVKLLSGSINTNNNNDAGDSVCVGDIGNVNNIKNEVISRKRKRRGDHNR